jgi:hypothetical protein
MFRTCAIFVLTSVTLAGCAAQYQGPSQADLDAGIRRDIQIGKETCARSFPISPRTNHAAQARCYNDYEVAVLRSRMRYADLSSLVNAKRLALAEKADQGNLTEAEVAAQMAETITYVTGESERRANSSAQTQAQISTALAAQSQASSAASSANPVQPQPARGCWRENTIMVCH